MHIPVGLIIVVTLLYFARKWWLERKRLRNIHRYLMMLHPQSDPVAMRQYVHDVYRRR